MKKVMTKKAIQKAYQQNKRNYQQAYKKLLQRKTKT